MRFLLLAALLMVSQAAQASDRENVLGMERGRDSLKSFEAESQLQRDLLGRKVVIDPDSKIDPNSLQLSIAPGSTLILRARQYDKGTQTIDTPFYQNVESPND